MCSGCSHGEPSHPPRGPVLTRRSALQRSAAWLAAAMVWPTPGRAAHLLVPMDDAQRQHLKAYGLTYRALTEGLAAEWLLNYRGGAPT